jgi:chemotaxis protein methyltransferase CheR
MNANPRIRSDFIDAVTTRETLFFRDESPFEALKHKALPEIIDAKSRTPYAKRLRFWSAACSSGQEPYSIGIALSEMLDDIDDWDIQILATDISPSALESASKGIYSDFEMSRGVSPAIRDKYFRKVPQGWRICDEVRSLVSFQSRNLLQPFHALGSFDVIFCRNVAIYFDVPVKQDLFERLAGVLAAHGVLIVGSSENLSCFGERWKPQFHCRGVYYQPNLKSSLPPRAEMIGGRGEIRPPVLSTRPALSSPSAMIR